MKTSPDAGKALALAIDKPAAGAQHSTKVLDAVDASDTEVSGVQTRQMQQVHQTVRVPPVCGNASSVPGFVRVRG